MILHHSYQGLRVILICKAGSLYFDIGSGIYQLFTLLLPSDTLTNNQQFVMNNCQWWTETLQVRQISAWENKQQGSNEQINTYICPYLRTTEEQCAVSFVTGQHTVLLSKLHYLLWTTFHPPKTKELFMIKPLLKEKSHVKTLHT